MTAYLDTPDLPSLLAGKARLKAVALLLCRPDGYTSAEVAALCGFGRAYLYQLAARAEQARRCDRHGQSGREYQSAVLPGIVSEIYEPRSKRLSGPRWPVV